MTFRPRETKAPLIIDPNGVLPFPIALERFEPVAGQGPKSIKCWRRIQDRQAFRRLLLEPLKSPDKLPARKSLGSLIAVALDHPEHYKNIYVVRQSSKHDPRRKRDKPSASQRYSDILLYFCTYFIILRVFGVHISYTWPSHDCIVNERRTYYYLGFKVIHKKKP